MQREKNNPWQIPAYKTGFVVLIFASLPLLAQPVAEKLSNSLRTDAGVGYLLPIGLAAYYLVAWFISGRVPRYVGVPVQYRAPEGLSPGSVAYIYTLGECDGRTYATILASLAARGALSFVPKEKQIFMQASPRLIRDSDIELSPSCPQDVPEEEKVVFKELFEWERTVKLGPPATFSKLVDHVRESLEKQFGNCFTRNLHWVIGGFAITAVCSAGMAYLLNLDLFLTLYIILVMVVWGFGSSLYWQQVRRGVKLALRGLYHRRTLPFMLALGLLAPAFWFTFFTLAGDMNPIFTRVTSLLLFINTFGPPALRNYTERGYELRRQIEGFRVFLPVQNRIVLIASTNQVKRRKRISNFCPTR